MLNAYKIIFHFMSRVEKFTLSALLFIRSFTSFLDLAGILLIGYTASSIARFVYEKSNEGQTISFFGYSIPAITAKTLPLILAGIAILFIAKSIFSILITRWMALEIARIETRAAKAIARQTFATKIHNFEKNSLEEINYTVQTSAASAFTGYLNNLAIIFTEGFLFLVLSATFFIFDPISTLFLVIYFVSLAIVIQKFVGKGLYSASQELKDSSISITTRVMDIFGSWREFSVAGSIEYYLDKISVEKASASNAVARHTYLTGMPRYIIETSLFVGIAIFVLIQSDDNNLESAAATIAVFITGGLRIMAAMLPWQNAIANIRQQAPQALPALNALEDISRNQTKKINSFTGDKLDVNELVKFQNVSFSYSEKKKSVLKNVNLSIYKGEQIAVIGKSGSGKSTLLDLVSGLISSREGEIRISRNLKIAYVPQHPGIISGSVEDNICALAPEGKRNKQRIKRAIEFSLLEKVISKLPAGLETDLGKHRNSLSGGELQRIGLARAIYVSPELLILDEFTSGLDADTEAAVMQNVHELKNKIAVLIVAHRLHTVKNADRVIVLEEGSIADVGTLGQLIKKNKSVEGTVKLLKIEK